MLTAAAFRKANVERCKMWHPGGVKEWTPLQWAGCVVGEVGECFNARKKTWRGDGSVAAVLEELADVFTYCDLLSEALGDTGDFTRPACGIDAWAGECAKSDEDQSDHAMWCILIEVAAELYTDIDSMSGGRNGQDASEEMRMIQFDCNCLKHAVVVLMLRYGAVPSGVIAVKFNAVSRRVGSSVFLPVGDGGAE
jgi:NTP pyrophosphatase (non-canonical NTP hydrolase)